MKSLNKAAIMGILIVGSLGISFLMPSNMGLAGQTPGEPDPLQASHQLGAEHQLSPDGEGNRYHPNIAYNYNHGEYMVVWHNTWPGGERDIYARRVSRTGEVLSWFAVSAGPNNRFQPAVAYNGTNDEYLVVWMYEADPVNYPGVYEIWGRRILWNAPGSFSEFLIIEWANRSFWTPRVAWNSNRNEYFVVWNAMNTASSFPPGVPNDIAGYRLSASGVVQNPGSPLILTDLDSPHQVDLAFNHTTDEYFIAFTVVHSQLTTSNDIYGLRVGWNGIPINPPGLIHICEIAKNQDLPAVATNGVDRYMVAFEHEYGGSDHDIYGAEYDWTGSPMGSYFTIASWTEDTTVPDIAAGANNEWLVVWQQALGGGSGDAIKGFRWGDSGATTYFFTIAEYAFWENENPAVAADIPGYLIAYEGDSSTTYRHIYGRIWWPEVSFLPVISR